MTALAAAPPAIVITGIRRSGLNLLAGMLRAGGIPDAPAFTVLGSGLRAPGFCFAFDPQSTEYLPIDKKQRIGLYVDRSSRALIRSIARQNAEDGRAPLSPHETRILRDRLVLDLRRARDAAARQFSPLFVLGFDAIITDPAAEAERLMRILATHYPRFSAHRASLAVRRIVPPRLIFGRANLRLLPSPAQ